jgi:PAS domain S-box-containing protein
MEDASFEYIKTPGFPTLKLTKSVAPVKSPHFISINSLYDFALIVDGNGRIIVANAKAERRFGGTNKKLIGSHITELIKNARQDLFKKILANVTEKQYTIMEAICTESNGRSFIAEIAVSPERVAPSNGICFLIRDITARAEAEARLKTINQAVYNANYGIAILNNQLNIEFSNPALLEIIKSINKQHFDSIEGRSITEFFNLPPEFFENGKEQKISIETDLATNPDKEPIKLRINCIPNTDKNGKAIGIILFCEDISVQVKLEQERIKAEEQRVLAEQWKERLKKLSDLTYAINNPLQALLGKAELENRGEEKNLIMQVVGILKEYVKSESDSSNGEKTLPASPIETFTSLTPCSPDTLLLVEDDKNVSDIFIRLIKKNYPQLKIHNVFNGKEGLQSFSQNHHLIVIMDINIPEMNGIELYNAIKALSQRNLWEVPYVIFCTGFSSPPELTEIITNENKHILLTKPITGSVLVKAIENFITQKGK